MILAKKSKHKDILNGLGAGMIASELFQENPFGIGKSEAEIKGNLALSFILLGTLAIV